MAARKTTWEMTAIELAKTVAREKGWQGNFGGWILDQQNRTVAHGWAALADLLTERGVIAVGRGIDWQRFHTVAGRVHLPR